MADDFIRIVYRREVGGRVKRSSVSIDPLLFEIFSKIRGSIAEARDVLREWAKTADAERTEENWRIGNSRIVQQRMSQEILELVNDGMAFRAQQEPTGGKGKGKVRGAGRSKAANATPTVSQQLPSVTGHLEADHG